MEKHELLLFESIKLHLQAKAVLATSDAHIENFIKNGDNAESLRMNTLANAYHEAAQAIDEAIIKCNRIREKSSPDIRL